VGRGHGPGINSSHAAHAGVSRAPPKGEDTNDDQSGACARHQAGQYLQDRPDEARDHCTCLPAKARRHLACLRDYLEHQRAGPVPRVILAPLRRPFRGLRSEAQLVDGPQEPDTSGGAERGEDHTEQVSGRQAGLEAQQAGTGQDVSSHAGLGNQPGSRRRSQGSVHDGR
jgi:hypothetical protein